MLPPSDPCESHTVSCETTGERSANKRSTSETGPYDDWGAKSKCKRKTWAEIVRVAIIRIRDGIVTVDWGSNVHRARLGIDDRWPLLWRRHLLRRLSIEQPHSCGRLKAGPAAGRLLGGHELLRHGTRLLLHYSVLHNVHALCLLAIDNDRLNDTFERGLGERGIGVR